jgi:hypothetical protein
MRLLLPSSYSWLKADCACGTDGCGGTGGGEIIRQLRYLGVVNFEKPANPGVAKYSIDNLVGTGN